MNEQFNSNVYPYMLSIQDEDMLSPLHTQELFGVKYEITSPSSILYQILYKVETTDDDDDDDFF